MELNKIERRGDCMSFKFGYLPDGPQSAILQFEGFIDEDFIQKDIQLNQSAKFVFDFQKTIGINSCGIREMVQLIKRAESTSAIDYINCPPFIIAQMNMVNGFLGPNKKVVSLYIPYSSENPAKNLNVHTLVKDIDAKKLPVTFKDENGIELKFDGSAVKFFKFLLNS